MRRGNLQAKGDCFGQTSTALATTVLNVKAEKVNLLIFEKSMSQLVNPIEVSAEQASLQAILRRTSSSNRIEDVGLQFLAIVRSPSSRIFGSLGPNELCRIQFRRCDRKVEHL